MQKTIRHWWKKSKMAQTDGEIFHILGLEESILWKWLYYPKQSHRFSAVPIKLPMVFFTEIEQKISQFVWKQKAPNSQSSPEKEEWSRRNHLPDFRLHYKATAIKTAWCWHRNRNIDPCNKTESPETNPHTPGHLLFYKGDKNIQWRKDSLFCKWC